MIRTAKNVKREGGTAVQQRTARSSPPAPGCIPGPGWRSRDARHRPPAQRQWRASAADSGSAACPDRPWHPALRRPVRVRPHSQGTTPQSGYDPTVRVRPHSQGTTPQSATLPPTLGTAPPGRSRVRGQDFEVRGQPRRLATWATVGPAPRTPQSAAHPSAP